MPVEVILATLFFATITGWAITWRSLKRENARLFAAAIAAANERNEALIAATYLHSINQSLGQQMREAGLEVALIGCNEPGCRNCEADEWPSELEAN